MKKGTLLVSTLLAWSSWAASFVSVDLTQEQRRISPGIYGMTEVSDAQASRLGVTLRGQNGNIWSRYNWKTSFSNEGGDVNYFKNTRQPPGDGGAQDRADALVLRNKALGLASLIEVPSIGYVASGLPKADGGTACGFSVGKYGPQLPVDPNDPDCGRGVRPDGGLVTGNDPADTSIAADEVWARDWVAHLVSTHGSASDGGVRYYGLSNQPGLWNQTHRDIHPSPSTYAEVKDKLERYGQAVKAADPSALTYGPSEWGWMAYFDSAAQERTTYGVDFVPYYLTQANLYEVNHGQRILDYLDLHIYPQATGVVTGDVSTPAVQALRLRSTRILWDPTYLVESWEACCYGGTLNLLPRMRSWVFTYYPGTKLSVSSYWWGALEHINGALAQVDVLGIFGREGVDFAQLDRGPLPGSFGEDAFLLYRDYDGAGARFGDTSVQAVPSDPATVSAFAAYDQAGHVHLVLVNKSLASAETVTVGVWGMPAVGGYRVFGFDANAHLAAVGTGTMTGEPLPFTLPAQSARLVEFTPQGGVDAGYQGGTRIDAGQPDAGGTGGGAGGGAGGGGAGGGEPEPAGCNCSSGAAALLPLALLCIAAFRRGRRGRLG